jgi:tetratricopeptide (TPR) repeat protein
MTRQRLILGGAAAGLAVLALMFGGVLHDSSSASPEVAIPAPTSQQLQTGFSPGNTAGLISSLQETLRTNPNSVKPLDLLGLAYQQAARETGDPSYYARSEQALRRALRLAPDDLLATSGLGSLALSRHRFDEALAFGRRARALSPGTALNYGVIGDALLELGRYPEAFRAFDKMSALRPSLSSYARIAHARELIGDVPGAIAAMKLALSASLGQGEAEAWTHVQLGKLHWSVGRIDAAAAEYRAALRAFPGYAYALDQFARAQAAHGRYGAAIATAQQAVDRVPLPQYVAMLGDLYRVTGQERLARKQYALIEVIQRLLAANGVKSDLETALFDVDHAIRLPQALALARAARAERPSIEGDDVLGWALARNGRCSEALVYSKRALRLGTKDALTFFHRGAIERCLGHDAAARMWFARALHLNPHFSILWAPTARKGLA